MPIKSQEFNIDEIYPDDYSDDEKYLFDTYLLQARTLYPNYEDWIMKLAITAHINKEVKGKGIPLDKDEALKLREQYMNNIKGIYETPSRK